MDTLRDIERTCDHCRKPLSDRWFSFSSDPERWNPRTHVTLCYSCMQHQVLRPHTPAAAALDTPLRDPFKVWYRPRFRTLLTLAAGLLAVWAAAKMGPASSEWWTCIALWSASIAGCNTLCILWMNDLVHEQWLTNLRHRP